MNLIPYISTWSVLALAVIVIAIYRVRLARRDDQSLDVMANDTHLIEQQQMAIKRIRRIDLYGQALTVVTITYGLVIAALYLYHIWLESSKIPQ